SLDARNAKRIAYRIMQTEKYQQLKYTTLFGMICVPKGSRQSFKNNPEHLPDGIPQIVLGDFDLDPSVYSILFADDRADYHTGNANLGTDAMVAYHIAKDIFSDQSAYAQESDPVDGVSRLFLPNYWRVYYSVFAMKEEPGLEDTDTYKYLWAWSYLMDQVSPAFSTKSWGRIPKWDVGFPRSAKATTADLACAEFGEQAIEEVSDKQDLHPELFEDRGPFKTAFYGMKSVSGRAYRPVPVILKQCADCHDPNEPEVNFAPYIPFGNETAFKLFVQSEQRGDTNRFLRKVKRYVGEDEREAHLGGLRMPLGRKSLTEHESAAFILYLESL
ncbi:MAG: hypothetical protein AAF202_03155, partial [Pseudomonadota bacterium]